MCGSPALSNLDHFFISYNKADRDRAQWIARQLRDADYTVIIQADDFGPGSNFVLEMDRAAKEAERTIAVLSPDYLTALFTHPEWAAAFAKDPTGKDRKLIPVRVRECQPEGLLGQVVYIDLVGRQDAVARRLLLDGVGQGTRASHRARAFPERCPRSGTSPTCATRTSPAAKICSRNSARRSLRDAQRPSSRSPDWAALARRSLRWSTPIATPPTTKSSGGCARKTQPR